MPAYIHFFMLFSLLFSTTLFASVGKVSLLKGEAYAQRETQKLALANGSILEEKDIIATAKDAQMQIIFEDKTVITLGSESELKIEEYFNDATKPKAKFKFGEGSFKSITGQIGKTAPENFTLETKTATIGIRGTTIQGRVGRGGDHIACLSGTITVGAIGSPNIVVVPAGKSTFVAPGTPPTPPQTIKPQSGGTLPSGDNPPPPPAGDNPPPPPPTNNFSSVVNQANNNDLNDRVKEVVTSAPVYNGFVTSYSLDAQEAEHDFIGQTVSYSKHPIVPGLFTFSAPAYEINPSTGALFQASPSFSGEVYTDTDRYGYTGVPPNEVPNATAIPVANTSFSHFSYTNQETYETEKIWYDAQGEIAIYSLQNSSNPTFLFVGPQSSTVPDTGLLYFLDTQGIYNGSNNDVSSLTSRYLGVDGEGGSLYDLTAVIVNNQNKKILSLYFDTYGPMIGIGKLNSNASLEMKRYWYWSSNSDFETGLATLKGAIYGSENQALAVSGVESYTYQYSGEGISVDPTEYYSTYAVALKDVSERVTPSANYANVQTLTGTLSQQNLDGSATTYENLSITLKKTQGTVSVSSPDVLNIGETTSAYIHDNYFATVSTTTFQGTEVMKDYLMAIPYGSGENDYVSWGYWGTTSYTNGTISKATTPFSTWVAGIPTPTATIDNLIATSKVYDYAGNVIGSVIEEGAIGAILNDSTNAINLNINFGTSSITGSMAFKTSLNSNWGANVTTSSLTNTGFNASMTGGHSSEAGVSGNLNGKFYGPAANNIAGAFNLTTTNNPADKAVGSFKAIKQPIIP